MPARSRVVLTALVVGGLSGSSAAGCSTGEPTAAPPLAAVPEHHATARTAAPVPGPARGTVTEAGAATAVVRQYYRSANRLATEMDPASLAALFTSGCPCRTQVTAVRQAAARHEHYVDHARLLAVHASIEDRDHAYVLVALDASAGGLERADGSRVTFAPPRPHLQRVFRLVRIGRSWLIERIEAVR